MVNTNPRSLGWPVDLLTTFLMLISSPNVRGMVKSITRSAESSWTSYLISNFPNSVVSSYLPFLLVPSRVMVLFLPSLPPVFRN